MFGLTPEIRPSGDRMVLVEFPAEITAEINDAVHRLAAALESARIPGVGEWTPCYRSLGVHYDPSQIRYDELVQQLRQLLSSTHPYRKVAARRVEVPVVYGGGFGPDLEWVATAHGLGVEDVVALHSKAVYRVFLIGFTPGFPYLGGLPEILASPRLQAPRALVPAGSVAIGGSQCGIYPIDSPGGWRILGRTPLRLFDVRLAEPCLLGPGDEVVFCPIREEQFLKTANQVGAS